jgi:hypothetical protein
MAERETTFKIDILFGHCAPEMRYVRTGPDSIECQGRSKKFNKHGVCTETTPWTPLSRATNVPAEMMPMFLGVNDATRDARDALGEV